MRRQLALAEREPERLPGVSLGVVHVAFPSLSRGLFGNAQEDEQAALNLHHGIGVDTAKSGA